MATQEKSCVPVENAVVTAPVVEAASPDCSICLDKLPQVRGNLTCSHVRKNYIIISSFIALINCSSHFTCHSRSVTLVSKAGQRLRIAVHYANRHLHLFTRKTCLPRVKVKK